MEKDQLFREILNENDNRTFRICCWYFTEAEYDQSDRKLAFFRNLLQTMNHADRTLVPLYLEELSTKEMAEITGLTESNVRVKLYRIKEQIKTKWEERQNGTR
ncbi:MAG: sigma-70 region 4 domain-containing protein [Bacteroidota bacterium]